MISTHELGSALRLLRVRRNMTQGDVAAQAKITKAMLSSFEVGHKLPSFQSLTAILNALTENFQHLQEALAEVRRPRPATGIPIQSEGLGKALRLLRTQRDRTQVAVAKEAGLSKAMLSTYENGRCLPSMPSLTAVLDALKCDFHGLQEAILQASRGDAASCAAGNGQIPAQPAETALDFLGDLQVQPNDGEQAFVAVFESLDEEGPSVYVRLHPALRSLTSRRATLCIEVRGPHSVSVPRS